MINYEITIGGMSCSSCSNRIINKLKDIDFVKKSSINLLFNKLFISIDSKNDTNSDYLEEIQFEIENMGFKVKSSKELINNNSNLRSISLYSNDLVEVRSYYERNKHQGLNSINSKNIINKNEKESNSILIDNINNNNLATNNNNNYLISLDFIYEITITYQPKLLKSYDILNDLNGLKCYL